MANMSADMNASRNDDELEQLTVRTTAELVLGTLTYIVIIFMTISGNILVVMAVMNYRPLKKVQNYFLVSLAASDLCVATLVMPLHVVKFLAGGRWLLGVAVCQMFTTFDILCCTASILNLCAIAIDRYWAIHNPIDYAQKRTLRLVSLMIFAVWVVSALISIPPLIGWNDWSNRKLMERCELTTERAFVVFSASGSFFLPLMIMTIVYLKIFIAARQRIRTNRGRSALVRINKMTDRPTPTAQSNGSPRGHILLRGERTPLVIGVMTGASLQNALDHTSEVAADMAGEESTKGRRTSEERPRKTSRGIGRFLRPHSTLSANTSNGGLVIENPNSDKKRRFTDASIDSSKRQSEISDASEGLHVLHPQATTSSLLKRREKISVAKEKKAAKTLAVIMGVFVLCWLPFFLMYVIMPFCTDCSLHPKVAEAITWLGYINSAINPVIYTIFNLDFRRAFEKFLCPTRIRRKRRFSNAPH
uniref:G-protein coupled receptors family 1 profile domain-containing protein n=1 Tax=Plectus sambesii TaxID=2011161 RepID=A0A914VFD1_9BILA